MCKSEDHGDTPPGEAPEPSRLALRAGAEIERQLATPMAAGLYLVATPIGNLGDITLRALAVLSRSDLICCEDTRHSRTLLAHFGIDRPLRPYHEHNAHSERPRILEALAAGKAVALISDAGTPLVSDPGYKLVRAALDAGHLVTALPGPSAVLAGAAVSGLPTDTLLFAGFLPVKDGARRNRLEELTRLSATVVVFEAPTRLARTLAALAALAPDREVAVARELTKRFEEVRRGTTVTLARWAAETEIRGEIVLLIAPPAAGEGAATDERIAAELAKLLPDVSLKDAVRTVCEALAAPRSQVYAIALRLKEAPE